MRSAARHRVVARHTYGEVKGAVLVWIVSMVFSVMVHLLLLFKEVRPRFNIQIVDKFVSTNLDTVRYIQFLKCHRIVNPFPWIPDYEEYYEEKVYYNLNSLYLADTTFSNALYNGRKISYTHFTHGSTYEWWHS